MSSNVSTLEDSFDLAGFPERVVDHTLKTTGIFQGTFSGNHFAEIIETAILEFEDKEASHLNYRSVDFSLRPLWTHCLESSRKDAAAQREAQEGDIQGQEGAEAGHARGPTADHHSGTAHAGRGGAPDRGVRVRGHTPHHHRVSAWLQRTPWAGRGKQMRNGFHVQRCYCC